MHKPDSYYQRVFAKRAPELNSLHLETLAYSVGSTLNGMPSEFFDEIIKVGRQWGAKRLEAWHNGETGHAR